MTMKQDIPDSLPERSTFDRRRFLKLLGGGALGAAALACGGIGYFTRVEPARIEVVEIHLKLPNLDRRFNGLRLAQISDIHMDNWMTRARLERCIDLVTGQKPHLVAITGDLITRHLPIHIDELSASLQPLAASVPTFAVLVNHDHWKGPEK